MMMAFYRHARAMLWVDILFIRKWIEAGIDYSQRRILFGTELMVVVRKCRKRHHVMAEQTREERKPGNWRTGKKQLYTAGRKKQSHFLLGAAWVSGREWALLRTCRGWIGQSPVPGSCSIGLAVSFCLLGRRMPIVVHAEVSSKTHGLRLNIHQCNWLRGWWMLTMFQQNPGEVTL